MPEAPATKNGSDYFKIGFDESCVALLPKQFPFLIDPLNNQKIQFSPTAAARVQSIVEILTGLVSTMNTDPELILAHLNSLLTEINTAYFSAGKNPADGILSTYIDFKVFVENNFTGHPTINGIAEKLAINIFTFPI